MLVCFSAAQTHADEEKNEVMPSRRPSIVLNHRYTCDRATAMESGSASRTSGTSSECSTQAERSLIGLSGSSRLTSEERGVSLVM